jgi:hypothetical protein
VEANCFERCATELGVASSILQLLKGQINDFLELHNGAYLGYTKQRRMPDAYGLRSLWWVMLVCTRKLGCPYHLTDEYGCHAPAMRLQSFRMMQMLCPHWQAVMELSQLRTANVGMLNADLHSPLFC